MSNWTNLNKTSSVFTGNSKTAAGTFTNATKTGFSGTLYAGQISGLLGFHTYSEDTTFDTGLPLPFTGLNKS